MLAKRCGTYEEAGMGGADGTGIVLFIPDSGNAIVVVVAAAVSAGLV